MPMHAFNSLIPPNPGKQGEGPISKTMSTRTIFGIFPKFGAKTALTSLRMRGYHCLKGGCGMDSIGMNVLSGYERSVLKSGKGKTKSDAMAEMACTREKLKAFLGAKVRQKLPDGTEVEFTAEELIIAAAIGDAVSKGSFDKVIAMMKASGQMDESVSVVAKVDQDLLKRSIG